MGQSPVYLWRAGGYACEMELLPKPSILLGSMLANDASAQGQGFLTARAAELYRTGHTLCERLNDSDLLGLVAALCMAVVPDAMPLGATVDGQKWATTISGPMTAQIRQMLAPKVQTYLQQDEHVDVAAWRRGCLCSANRTALLVSCDIEEAINCLLRVRGFDDLMDEQRVMVLQEAPEELDLVRFAISDGYFRLRQSLGLALRKAKSGSPPKLAQGGRWPRARNNCSPP